MRHRHPHQRLVRLGMSVMLVLLSFAVVLAPAAPAKACSCAPPDPLGILAEAPAAFIGTVVDIRKIDHPSDWIDVVVVFDVEEWVKGDLGDTVEIGSSADGASCGFEMEPGDRSGIWINEIQTPLLGGLCNRVDADVLRNAAAGLPEVFSEGGLASMLMVGSFGSVGVIALDAEANIVGYGAPAHPEAWWSEPSVCPGGRTMVELVPDRDLFVRDLRTLQITESMTLEVDDPNGVYTYFNHVVCTNEAGSEFILVGTSFEEPDFTVEEEEAGEEFEEYGSEVGVIYRRSPSGLEKLTEIDAGEGGFFEARGDLAVLTLGKGTSSVYAIDLVSGEVRLVHEYERNGERYSGPFIEGFAMSRSGRFVAAMDANLPDEGGVTYFLSIFDLESDQPLVARSPMVEAGAVAFIDDDTVAYLLSYHTHEEGSDEAIEGEKSGFVQLFDAGSLDLVGEWSSWDEGWPTVIDGMFYSIDNGGTVSVTDPRTGERAVLGSLPSSEGRIVELLEPVELAPSAREAPESFGEFQEAAFEDLGTFEGDEVDGTALIRTWAIAILLLLFAALASWMLFFRRTPVDGTVDDA